MAEQEKTVQRTFRFDEQTMAMLREIADYHGTSMADVVRRMITDGFREKFGDTITCGDCMETHVVKNPHDSGWASMLRADKSVLWACPKCLGAEGKERGK